MTYAQGGIISGGDGDQILPYRPTHGERVFCFDGRIMEWQTFEDEDGLRLMPVGKWDLDRMREMQERINRSWETLDRINRGEA